MKRTRRCRKCGVQFVPVYNSLNQTHCEKSECFKEMIKEKISKQAKKRQRQFKKQSMTLTDWILKTQKVFNAYIRERDIGLVCISCQKPPKKKNAGHYLNANNHWITRFDEDNVHLQCEHCNNSLSGNLIKYRQNLILKIGEERVLELEKKAYQTAKYSIPEVKEILEHYKQKLKRLKNENAKRRKT